MYGVIDIGSNTIRLSIYKKDQDGFRLMLHKKSMAGLAGYVDKRGNLSEKGIRRAIAVLNSFRQVLANIEVSEVFVFATASLRNIQNTQTAVDTICRQTGFDIDLISGEQEGVYDFVGASQLSDLDKGVLVDIGGGSTELVFYSEGKMEKSFSIPVGSLNLYSRFVEDILPSKKEMGKIKKHIEEQLATVDMAGDFQVVCGVGGSMRALCRLHNEIYRCPLSNRTMEMEQVREMFFRCVEERDYAVRKIIKVIPDRIHTILPGIAILDVIAERYGAGSIIVNEYGVREGYLYTKLFAEGETHDEMQKETQAIHAEPGAVVAEI